MAHRLSDGAQTVRRRLAKSGRDSGLVRCARNFHFVETSQASFHRSEGFLDRLVEGPANRHRLAHGFHRGGEVGFRARELLKCEARDFGDDIVDGRLERCRRDLGDVVVQFVERVTNS